MPFSAGDSALPGPLKTVLREVLLAGLNVVRTWPKAVNDATMHRGGPRGAPPKPRGGNERGDPMTAPRI